MIKKKLLFLQLLFLDLDFFSMMTNVYSPVFSLITWKWGYGNYFLRALVCSLPLLKSPPP
jgi:hypothetical protein